MRPGPLGGRRTVIGSTLRSVQTFVGREADRCRAELATICSAGRPIPVAHALSWSVASIMWGNGVVAAGRRFGHDQWVTLVGVPLFGLAGWWWLARRGFRREAIGMQLPRIDHARLLTGLTVAAALFVGVCTAAGLATSGQDMRALRTTRTLVGTAFGEELIHRGVLLALWANTRVSASAAVVANMVVFGAWHIAGATCHGFHPWEVFGPLVGAIPLVWLRLRFRSIFAPMAVHAATNIGGVFKAPKAPC
jgi:membrane protease YdiL (CAAX protease family)